MRAEQLRRARVSAAVLLLVMLGACGRDELAPVADVEADAPLPQPQQTDRPLTAMPGTPGPGDVPLGGSEPSVPEPRTDHTLLPLEGNPESGLTAVAGETAVAAPEPTPEQATAVIRTYYAAINAVDYARAYALWSDGGRGSGQSPEQFAAGFGETSVVMVDIGVPGAVDAAAGSRYIEIPVSLRAQQSDGSSRRFEGRYVLRRAMVDGASDAQRAWRIASADLREISAP